MKSLRRATIKKHTEKHAGYFREAFDREKDLKTEEISAEESNEAFANYLVNKINKSSELSKLYGAYRPPVLSPAQFEILTRNGKPYMLGEGDYARVILAQKVGSQELVAIKISRNDEGEEGDEEDEKAFEKDMLREMGRFLKAQDAIVSDGYPVALHGFMRIKDDSPLACHNYKLMPVIGVASLTPNDPVSMSLQQAFDMMKKDSVALFTPEIWADIILQLLRCVRSIYNAGVRHNDLHAGNILISMLDEQIKLSIIDYGSSSNVNHSHYCPHQDLYELMTLFMDPMLECVPFRRTKDYVGQIKRHKTKSFRLTKFKDQKDSYNKIHFDDVIAKLECTLQKDLESFR